MAQTTMTVEPRDDLRWIADSYEQAQRMRVQAGERLRAVLQGRAGSAAAARGEAVGADGGEAVAADGIAAEGHAPTIDPAGASDFLRRVHRMHAEAEEAAREAMLDALARHPAWPWLSGVKGVGVTLACRLLARLDPVRAKTPSAFWAYCGLATVPGREYRCETCRRSITQPAGFRVTGAHRRLGGSARCPDVLRPGRGPDEGVRAAQPRHGPGGRPAYNPQAKHVCYLILVSFLRCGGPYAEHYRAVKAELERTRAGWAKGRIHLTAGRKTQKLFLAHLWRVWREGLNLPVTAPNAAADTLWLDPWKMTRAAKSAA